MEHGNSQDVSGQVLAHLTGSNVRVAGLDGIKHGAVTVQNTVHLARFRQFKPLAAGEMANTKERITKSAIATKVTNMISVFFVPTPSSNK